MKLPFAVLALASAFFSTPASACIELHNQQSDTRAFDEADMVARVEALTETYIPIPAAGSLRTGVATGRVTEALKGRLRQGDIIAYRVVDGQQEPGCPARRFTRPGQNYKLHLQFAPDGGPPLIIYATDAYRSGGAR